MGHHICSISLRQPHFGLLVVKAGTLPVNNSIKRECLCLGVFPLPTLNHSQYVMFCIVNAHTVRKQPYWCISRSYGHPLVLLSLEMGVNSVGAAKRRADGVMRGWRECLDLICAIVLATAGLMLAVSVSWLSHCHRRIRHYPPHVHADKQLLSALLLLRQNLGGWLALFDIVFF